MNPLGTAAKKNKDVASNIEKYPQMTRQSIDNALVRTSFRKIKVEKLDKKSPTKAAGPFFERETRLELATLSLGS
ncbi:MAG: hypothetical protein RLZZ519_3174 [Bacteroidota bacterium]|jgi:hypothetical protein